MTLVQLEAIYKANLLVGPLEALEAVYLQGYYDGAGISITSTTSHTGVLASRSAPSTLVILKRPDLR